MDFVSAAADLLLGASCPGCGTAATTLCPVCAARISPRPRPVRAHPVPVVAAGEHLAVLRLVVVAWKEESRSALVRPLAHLLAAAVGSVPLAAGTDPCRPVVLVPVPTSARSRRARGADVVDVLAREAAALLRRAGADVTVRQGLRPVRRTADQAGLGAHDRATNLHGAFGMRSSRGLAGRDVVVVDDVVTTGATLAEADRALTAAGHAPVGAAVVAARPRPDAPRT